MSKYCRVMRALAVSGFLAACSGQIAPGRESGGGSETGVAGQRPSETGGTLGNVIPSSGGAGAAGARSGGAGSQPLGGSPGTEPTRRDAGVPSGGTGGTDAAPAENVVDEPAQSFVQPKCSQTNNSLPPDAPSLTPGVWKHVGPSGDGVSFGAGSLTQGMALDPCNAATLYLTVCAAGGNAAFTKGLFRSSNGGTTWSRILAADSPNHLRVNPANPLEIYVTDGVTGGTNGLHRTRDGGQTWTHLTNMCEAIGNPGSCGATDLYDIAVDPVDFKHILVTGHAPWTWNDAAAGSGVLESKDGGDTWIAHPPSGPWGYGNSVHFVFRPDLSLGDPSTWIVGSQGAGSYRTTDAGRSWSMVSQHPILHGGATMYISDGGILYSSVSGGVIRSRDRGATFELFPTQLTWIGLIGDGSTLYSGRSTISTAPESEPSNWTNAPNGPPERDSGAPFEFAFDKTNRILYAASDQNGLWAVKLK